jgi:long-chain acyl-CoA synthetase
VGGQVSRLRQQGKEPSGALAFQHRLADKLVYSKLKARLGGRLRFCISGGAPLSRTIAEFFHSCDIMILDAYGLTETSAGSTGNRPKDYKFGTVGLPLKGVEIRIAEDGEILLRGRNIMKGYYNRPEDTAEALEPDGWFHSGDVGVVDADGFLTITDRKKDILVTAGGKNIAPQNIEGQLKASCPYISQAVMLGDRRPFCVALVTINEETTGKWAREHGIDSKSYADLASRPEVKQLIRDGIEAVNARLASYERIKDFHLLDHDLSQETGELTPKMSVKRKVVESRHQEILEGFYKETVARI